MQIKRDYIYHFSCDICNFVSLRNNYLSPVDCALIRNQHNAYPDETSMPIIMHAKCFRLVYAVLDTIAADFCTLSFDDVLYRVEKEMYGARERTAASKCCICRCYSQPWNGNAMLESYIVTDVSSSAGTRFGIHRPCYTAARQALQDMSAHEVAVLLRI
jgi:hypothetical protein